MHERTKEVDGLRRLAELLRQAMTNATGSGPTSSKKQPPRIRKFRRGDPDPDATPERRK